MIAHNKQIREANEKEIVDCLTTGVYGDAPEQLLKAFADAPKGVATDALRVKAIPFLFQVVSSLSKERDGKAVNGFINGLEKLTKIVLELSGTSAYHELFDGISEWGSEDSIASVEKETGDHYGKLFANFSIDQYLEARDLLETRLLRNNISIEGLEGKKVLDHGCGGGRYTIAWKLLGAREVVGLDFSEIGIQDARKKVEYLGVEGVSFELGSALDVPFEDDSFDIVFSNGVLHHTTDWEKGIEEQVRVLRPGGTGWQYLIENPGGIFWDSIEILRAIVKGVKKPFAQKIMASAGIPENRIFYMLDHVMVPINTRLTAGEIESALKSAGAANIRRLDRGTDFDRVEQIYQNVPDAESLYGVGENRFVFSK